MIEYDISMDSKYRSTKYPNIYHYQIKSNIIT